MAEQILYDNIIGYLDDLVSCCPSDRYQCTVRAQFCAKCYRYVVDNMEIKKIELVNPIKGDHDVEQSMDDSEELN